MKRVCLWTKLASLCAMAAIALTASSAVLAVQQNDPVPASSNTPEAPKAQPAPAADMPEAADIIEKAIEAMGGRKALDAVTSLTMKGSITMPMGNMPFENYWADGDRILFNQTIPGGQGKMGAGLNGAVGWRHMMGEYELLGEQDIERFKEQANFHLMLQEMEKGFGSVRTMGLVEFDGRKCYKLQFEEPKEDVRADVFGYFDQETHLMAGKEMIEETPGVPFSTTMKFKDWKKVGEVKLFRQMIIEQMGKQMVMEYTELEANTVEPKVFEVPAEVMKLVEEKKQAEADSENNGSAESGDDQ